MQATAAVNRHRRTPAMRADNTAHLAAAAKNRSDATMARALAAIGSAEHTGVPFTLTIRSNCRSVPRLDLCPTRPAGAPANPCSRRAPQSDHRSPTRNEQPPRRCATGSSSPYAETATLPSKTHNFAAIWENALARIRLTP
jgi:hypothetical protein